MSASLILAPEEDEAIREGLLAIGFIAVSIAIFTAYRTPATGYELSLYAATPISFWIGIGIALSLSLPLSFISEESLIWTISLFLAGISVTSIVMLPILRGYYHVNEGDSMTHMGFVRDILSGISDPLDISYPFTHTMSIIYSSITGMETTRSFQYIVVLFCVVYFIFIPLVIRTISPDQLSITIGLFSGLLLLPTNLISVHMHLHPTTQAILFCSLLLYFLTRIIHTADKRIIFGFMIAALALLMLHPQQAANFLLLLTGVVISQLIRKFISREVDYPISVLMVWFGLLFWIWFQNTRFSGSLAQFFESLLIVQTVTAEEVQSRGLSLSALGTGPEELFLKLFLVSALFCFLSGIIMLISIINQIRDRENKSMMIFYLTSGFIPVSVLFVAYIVASITTQYFRHLGFMMVIVTIIGTVAITSILSLIRDRTSLLHEKKNMRKVLSIFFIILLVASIPVIHPSPYIYQDSGHVTKATTEGFETSFEYHDHRSSYTHIRSGPYRYEDFIYGSNRNEYEYSGMVPDHFNNQNLPAAYDQSQYLIVTAADRERDVVLYDGFRFSEDDFEYLNEDPRIAQPYSNGDVELYRIEATAAEDPPPND